MRVTQKIRAKRPTQGNTLSHPPIEPTLLAYGLSFRTRSITWPPLNTLPS